MRCGAWGIYFISLSAQQKISQFAKRIISHLPQGKYFTISCAFATFML
jgi:uncharacterized protein YqjF (DUF2071 family)